MCAKKDRRDFSQTGTDPLSYDLPLNEGTIELSTTPWKVPEQYDGVVPFMAGTELPWQVA